MKIACDLFTGLKLYTVPEWALARLRAKFPNVEILKVDLKSPKTLPQDVQVYWGNYLTPEIATHLKGLRWIHFAAVGVSRALIPQVLESEIQVTNSKGLLVAPVVSSVMAFITGLARGFHVASRLRHDHHLTREAFDDCFENLRDLEGDTCLIVGLGDIGTRVAVACQALGMRVVGIKRDLTSNPIVGVDLHGLERLPDLVEDADFVVNLLPLTPATLRIFSKPIFAKMKRGGFFINCGRGPTMDQEALQEHLRSGHLGGAGLDVFVEEPLPESSPLWREPNTILTPHVACNSDRYWERQITHFEQNIARFQQGESLLNRVDLQRGY